MSQPAKPDIRRLIELQQLMIRFHHIQREVYHTTLDRKETDTEHSYSLAMAAWFLAQYFPELDTGLVIRLALVHDLVEIHAGDTFAYGSKEEIDSKAAREAAAAKRLLAEWADFPEMNDAIERYERRDTPEAKFVYALDKVMPAILNYLNKGDIWRRHNITIEQFMSEKEAKVPVSPEIYRYYRQLLALLREHPDYFPKSSTQAAPKP